MLERRAAADDDEPFLRELFATARPDLAAAREQTIVDLQVRAQRREWEQRYPGLRGRAHPARRAADRAPLGRVAAGTPACSSTWRCCPEHRRGGIGTRIVGEVLAEADRRGVPVRVTVERGNSPSLAFCAKHGFAEVGGDAVYVVLERPVSADRPPPASG